MEKEHENTETMDPIAEVAVPTAAPETDLIAVPEDGGVQFEQDAEKAEQSEPELPEKDVEEPPKRRSGKDYQTRISELTRKRHEAEEREAAALARLDMMTAQIKQLDIERSAANATDKERELLDRKKKALDDMDLSAYDAVSEELLSLRLQQRQEAPKEAPKEAPRDEPQRETTDNIAESAKAWMDGNVWYKDAANRHLVSEVHRIERELLKSGMTYSQELYSKLDEELDKLPEFDEVRGRSVDTTPDEPVVQQERPRSVVSPPSNGATPPPKPRPDALTEYDKTTMRRFGLDPSDAKHRKHYLARKSRT